MAKKGITYAEIIDCAMKLVEERGYARFSLRELAFRLGVKPSSLYNHVAGVEEINTCIAVETAKRLNRALQNAIDGAMREEADDADEAEKRDRAFMAAADAYRRFAMENAQLYAALIQMPKSDDDKIVTAAFHSFAPMRELIKSYEVGEVYLMNYIRGLRSVMHGFVELCHSGFMQRGTISRDESYRSIIKEYLNALNKESIKEKEVKEKEVKERA